MLLRLADVKFNTDKPPPAKITFHFMASTW